MNLSSPLKIKLIRMVKPNVLVKVLATNEFLELNPNEFVRRIEEGKYELVETNVKSRSNAFAAPAP